MYSKTHRVRVKVVFFGPEKGGRKTPAVTDVYHPRIATGDYFWSVWIETLDGQPEVLEFDKPYEVRLRLPSWEEMENLMGKSIETMFPAGSAFELSEGNNRVVAVGTIIGIEAA